MDTVVDGAGLITFRTSKLSTGANYSHGFQLMLYQLPVISLQPMPSATATVGGDATLTTTATGEGALTY